MADVKSAPGGQDISGGPGTYFTGPYRAFTKAASYKVKGVSNRKKPLKQDPKSVAARQAHAAFRAKAVAAGIVAPRAARVSIKNLPKPPRSPAQVAAATRLAEHMRGQVYAWRAATGGGGGKGSWAAWIKAHPPPKGPQRAPVKYVKKTAAEKQALVRQYPEYFAALAKRAARRAHNVLYGKFGIATNAKYAGANAFDNMALLTGRTGAV